MSENSEVTREILAQLKQERRNQRINSYFKYSVLGGLGLVYLYFFAASGVLDSKDQAPAKDYAAVVRVTGEIMPGKEASAQGLNPLLEKAFADKNAKGVVLLINSPGGTPVQSALVYDRIQELKKKTGKKVVAVGEDLMASGAYMIAVSADEIVVNRSTVTGSIGVVSRSFGFTGLMEKLGVERRVATAGEAKNMLDPFGPQTETDKSKQTELLLAIHEHFKDTVKEGRGSKLDLNTPGLFSGTVWTGEAAVRLGLADRLGDAKSAAKDILGVTELRVYSQQKPMLEALLGGFASKVAQELKPEVSFPALALPN